MNKYHSEIICLVATAKMKANRNRKLFLLSLASCVVIVQCCACFARAVPFADNGTLKMLYDNRMHPQALEHDGSVYIVWRGEKGFPYIISYDLESREFSRPSMLLAGMEEKVDARKYKKDHHFSPVIWIDSEGYFHVLSGCHRTPGTHLISKQFGSIGSSLDSWDTVAQIAPGISYPTIFSIHDDKELIYYRTGGHTSSWTYRITDDNGKTWTGPSRDVTDMDINGRTEWSSYQTTLPSRDGRFLHVAFITYDDNKSDDPTRFYNPRYDQEVENEWKYNLYYVKIDLQAHDVTNFDGESMKTPIDIDQADAKCRIWDTKWRGAGVPPTILLDENGDPAFLHVLSEETLEDHQYYYVRRADGKWKQTPIAPSNHQWNSCHLARDDDGTLRAFLIVGVGYLDTGGYMDRYGGGAVEEWVSADKGNTWKEQRDLAPEESRYPGWKHNNIQPVTRPDGSFVDGLILFYGWQDSNGDGTAFLLDDRE
jgi:hypothetical protein